MTPCESCFSEPGASTAGRPRVADGSALKAAGTVSPLRTLWAAEVRACHVHGGVDGIRSERVRAALSPDPGGSSPAVLPDLGFHGECAGAQAFRPRSGVTWLSGAGGSRRSGQPLGLAGLARVDCAFRGQLTWHRLTS